VHSVTRVPRLSARHGGVFRQPGRAFGGCWPFRRTLKPRPLAEQRAFEHRTKPRASHRQRAPRRRS